MVQTEVLQIQQLLHISERKITEWLSNSLSDEDRYWYLSALSIVSKWIVATGRVWLEASDATNAAMATHSLLLELRCKQSARLSVMNECCASSSNKIFTGVEWLFALTVATTVFRRHTLAG